MKEEFNKTTENLSDNDFWLYVKNWLSRNFVLGIMNNWDEEMKENAIREIPNILNAEKKHQEAKLKTILLDFRSKLESGIIETDEDIDEFLEGY